MGTGRRSHNGTRLCVRYVSAILLAVLLIALFTHRAPKQDGGLVVNQSTDDGKDTTFVQEGATSPPNKEEPQVEDSVKGTEATPPPPEAEFGVTPAFPPADKPQLHVVINHYEEEPFYISTWLDDLRIVPYVKTLGLHVTIYTKGPSPNLEQLKETTAADEVIHLPNTGREGGTYLQHILKTYDDPPLFTLFTQAYLRKAQVDTGPESGHLMDWLTARLENKFDSETGFMSLDRKHDICHCGHCTDMGKAFYPLWPQLYTLMTERVCSQQDSNIMSFNGHFIVSRKRILARPRHMYEYLQELVEAPEDHWLHKEKEPAWFDQEEGKEQA